MPSTRFDHLVLTRFNVREPTWHTTDKQSNPTLDDEWMEHRFRLFERYTMPSVMMQTDQNFDWVVLFDILTAMKWQKRIDSYAGCFTPLYVHFWLREMQGWIKEHYNRAWLITTRLDNDDAISPSFIEAIQTNFEQRVKIIDAPYGYRLKGGKLYDHYEEANPFLSYVEPSSAGATALHVPHGLAIRKIAPITRIQATWLQVIHNRNYCNDAVRSEPRQIPGWVARYV